MPRVAQYLAAVERLRQFAHEQYGKSVLPLPSTIALWGARLQKQLAGFAEAFGWKLTTEHLADIEEILGSNIKDPIGPEFMAPPTR